MSSAVVAIGMEGIIIVPLPKEKLSIQYGPSVFPTIINREIRKCNKSSSHVIIIIRTGK